MATFHDPRERSARPSSRDTRQKDARARDDDADYTRELSERYGHGRGGYDRDAYPQGGYGGEGRDDPGRARHALDDATRDDFSPRRSDRRPSDGKHRQGGERVSTGLFGGGMDQDFRSGGQYQGESGHGARPAHGGDFGGGGYLGRGSGHGVRREARSGGAFGEDPRGWYGPAGGARARTGDAAQGRGSHRGRGPRNYTRSDQRIAEDLCERLTEDDHIDASGIEVEVEHGLVTLSGTVRERRMKHRAEDIAEACGGVQDVENRIRVSRDSEPASGDTPAS